MAAIPSEVLPSGETWAARWRRRSLSITGVGIAAAAALLLAPVSMPAVLIADLALRRRWICTRMLLAGGFYLIMEGAGLAAALATSPLALSRERTWLERSNYALQWWWGDWLLRGMLRIFSARLEVHSEVDFGMRPMLLFIRHTSPADTVLAVHCIQRPHRIRLRYVLKRELLWIPCLDVVGNRLPNYFVRRGLSDSRAEIAAIARLAKGLGPREGVLIYPEGARYTDEKKRRALERIEERGDTALLEKARAFRSVMPPQLGGTLALLDAFEAGDVVFCAHTGFEEIVTIRDLAHGRLIGSTVRVAFWAAPKESIPADREGRIGWLYEQWAKVDAFVSARASENRSPA